MSEPKTISSSKELNEVSPPKNSETNTHNQKKKSVEKRSYIISNQTPEISYKPTQSIDKEISQTPNIIFQNRQNPLIPNDSKIDFQYSTEKNQQKIFSPQVNYNKLTDVNEKMKLFNKGSSKNFPSKEEYLNNMSEKNKVVHRFSQNYANNSSPIVNYYNPGNLNNMNTMNNMNNMNNINNLNNLNMGGGTIKNTGNYYSPEEEYMYLKSGNNNMNYMNNMGSLGGIGVMQGNMTNMNEMGMHFQGVNNNNLGTINANVNSSQQDNAFNFSPSYFFNKDQHFNNSNSNTGRGPQQNNYENENMIGSINNSNNIKGLQLQEKNKIFTGENNSNDIGDKEKNNNLNNGEEDDNGDEQELYRLSYNSDDNDNNEYDEDYNNINNNNIGSNLNIINNANSKPSNDHNVNNINSNNLNNNDTEEEKINNLIPRGLKLSTSEEGDNEENEKLYNNNLVSAENNINKKTNVSNLNNMNNINNMNNYYIPNMNPQDRKQNNNIQPENKFQQFYKMPYNQIPNKYTSIYQIPQNIPQNQPKYDSKFNMQNNNPSNAKIKINMNQDAPYFYPKSMSEKYPYPQASAKGAPINPLMNPSISQKTTSPNMPTDLQNDSFMSSIQNPFPKTITSSNFIMTTTENNKRIKRINPETYLNESYDYLAHNIYQLAKDQAGCRFLQKKIDEEPEKATSYFYPAILPYILPLVKDPFGNYLIQKLLKNLSPPEIMNILQAMSNNILDIGSNSHGTRVMQYIINYLKTPELINYFLNLLSPYVIQLLKELNGTHIIQKFIFDFPEYSDKINIIVLEGVENLAKHRHGCCVLQKFLDTRDMNFKKQLIDKLIDKSLNLVVDQFGNYVIQTVLLLDDTYAANQIAIKLSQNAPFYSKHKYSSNVVEKCFDHCDNYAKQYLINALSEPEIVNDLIMDEHGNYVIQKVLACADPNLQNEILENIIPVLPKLKEVSFGERIISRLSVTYQVVAQALSGKDKGGTGMNKGVRKKIGVKKNKGFYMDYGNAGDGGNNNGGYGNPNVGGNIGNGNDIK